MFLEKMLVIELFYFSGHVVVDENNQAYLAPYDMDPELPYISGINLEQLRDVVKDSLIAAAAIKNNTSDQ
jgi:hypothetical protein